MGAERTQFVRLKGVIADRMISFSVECGDRYPAEAPVVRLQEKAINMPFIKSDGIVDFRELAKYTSFPDGKWGGSLQTLGEQMKYVSFLVGQLP